MTTDLILAATTQTDVVGTQPAAVSLENPVYDLNDPALYDLLTDGAEAPSGVRVSEEKALGVPAVWQAITMISGDVASLPLEVYRQESDGDRIKQESHPLFELVHWQPNDEMHAFKFWKRMLAYRLLWNNAYAWIPRNGDGTPTGLVPLLPDRTSIERHGGRLWVVTEVNERIEMLTPDDVFHLEGLCIDGLQGFKWIKAARRAVGLALAELNFVSKFYKNGGRVGGILELPAAMKKESRDKVEEGFKKRYSSNEAFQTIVLRDNAKFHQAQVTPEAAQVIDARRESVRDIARLFNIRPGKLGEESKNSFASKAEDNRDHLDTTLRPHLRDITQECRCKLLTPEQKRDGYYFAHDLRELLRMDLKSMAEAISTLRSSEVLSGNEARVHFLNMNRRTDPGGDDYRNPNTKSDPAPPTAADSEPADSMEPTAAAFRILLSGTVQRMARFVENRAKKLSADPAEFLAWIDDGYEGQRETISAAIGEIISAAAGVLEIEPESAIAETVEAFMSESLRLLQTVANSTPSESLRDVVSANVSEWATEAGERYAIQVFGTNPSE